jgi:hypothetical protein
LKPAAAALVDQVETAEMVPLQLEVQHLQLEEMVVVLPLTIQMSIGRAVPEVVEILQVIQLITVAVLIFAVVEIRPVQLTS